MKIDHLFKESYFSPSLIGGVKIELGSFKFKEPLLANVIDGCLKTAKWKLNKPCGATRSLFQNLKPLVSQHGASWFYITDPDNALSVINWQREATDFHENVLSVFEKEPALQGGVAYLCLIFHNLKSLLVFEYDEELNINYYGCEEFYRNIEEAIF